MLLYGLYLSIWFCLSLQAEECLKREKDRVAHYLHSSSEPKLLEVCSWLCAIISAIWLYPKKKKKISYLVFYCVEWNTATACNSKKLMIIVISYVSRFIVYKFYFLFFSFRKFNMSCYPCMQTNSLKKNILDVMHYLEMTRYYLNSSYLWCLWVFKHVYAVFWCFKMLRLKICQGCSGSFLKYLEAWILFPVYLSRLWHNLYLWFSSLLCMSVKIGVLFFFSFHFWLLAYKMLSPSTTQHVTAEGMALVKLAEDAASNKKVFFP